LSTVEDLDVIEGGANENQRAKVGRVLGDGQQAPPYQLMGLGSTVSSGQSPGSWTGFVLFQQSGWFF